MDLGLTGKVALITGGSYGIGKGIARKLAAEGANVAICARREEVLSEAVAEIEAETGRKALAVVGDVTKVEDCENFVRSVLDRFGRIDVLVNNAGSSSANHFEKVSDELWLSDLNLKLMAAVRLSRLCIPEMRKVGGGRIINITMIRAKQPGAKSVPTSVSRAAGMALTKAMSKDLAVDNILVNTVLVGKIRSGQHEKRYETVKDQYASLDDYYKAMAKAESIPLGRYGEPEEVGDLVAFLASERAKYITGDAINLDGGTSGAV